MIEIFHETNPIFQFSICAVKRTISTQRRCIFYVSSKYKCGRFLRARSYARALPWMWWFILDRSYLLFKFSWRVRSINFLRKESFFLYCVMEIPAIKLFFTAFQLYLKNWWFYGFFLLSKTRNNLTLIFHSLMHFNDLRDALCACQLDSWVYKSQLLNSYY